MMKLVRLRRRRSNGADQDEIDTVTAELRRVIDRTAVSSLANAEGRVCTDHLLVAIAQEPSSAFARLLSDRHIDLGRLLDAVDRRCCGRGGTEAAATTAVSFTPEAVAAFTLAGALAAPERRLVATEDAFLGVLGNVDGCGSRLLEDIGVTRKEIWDEASRGVALVGAVAIDRRLLDQPQCGGNHLVRGEGVLARAAHPADAGDLQASFDDEGAQWQGWDDSTLAATRANTPALLTSLDEMVNDLGWCALMLSVVSDSGAFIGNYRFDDLEFGERRATLGWWHTPSQRGLGHARAALAAVLEYGHRHLGLREIHIGTTTANVRAVRQIESSGASFLHARDHRLPNGSVEPSRWFVHHAEDRLPPKDGSRMPAGGHLDAPG